MIWPRPRSWATRVHENPLSTRLAAGGRGRREMKRIIALLATVAVCLPNAVGLAAAEDNAQQPPRPLAADASAFDNIAKDIEESVADLRYPKGVAQNLVLLTRDWKLDVWRQSLSRARQRFQRKQFSAADVAQAEEEVVCRLSETIRTEIAPCQRGRELLTYFYLSNVVKDKKAQCLGYCQLVYILGHSLGLRVAVIEVLEKAIGCLPPGDGHAACFVELSDGKVMMVDVGNRLVSKPIRIPRNLSCGRQLLGTETERESSGLHGGFRCGIRVDLLPLFYNNSAKAHSVEGDLAQAISFLTTAIELNPRYAEAYSNRGAFHDALGQLNNALADLNKAIELDPQFAAAYYNRGIAYAGSGQTAKAVSDYDKAIELIPNTPKHTTVAG